jgi:hypothetical protein
MHVAPDQIAFTIYIIVLNARIDAKAVYVSISGGMGRAGTFGPARFAKIRQVFAGLPLGMRMATYRDKELVSRQ